ncbi:MAG: DUF4190 domain-containing protein [Roseiflexaceae bacterium]
MNCPTCDAPLEPGVLFCANCGARVAQPSSAATPTIVLSEANAPTPPAAQPTYPAQTYGGQYSTGTPQPYMPPQPAYAPLTLPNSTAAIVSLVFGILSWIGLFFIGGIVAVVAGHMARNEIRNSGGQIGGSGMAMAGLILGYANIALSVLACLGFFVLVMIGAASSGG